MQSSEELSKLRYEIDELKEELMRLEKTTDPANQAAMQIMLAKHQQLTAMRQEKVLLMQREQSIMRKILGAWLRSGSEPLLLC
jgi:septal ring factor EnvC (AmiA/AmiB activator)